MALENLYRPIMIYWEEGYRMYHSDRETDDFQHRTTRYQWASGILTGEQDYLISTWDNLYKGVTRTNTILNSLGHAKDNITDEQMVRFDAEARFFRAVFYSYLIFLWGDVPYYTDYLSIEDAFNMGRTDKNIILKQIYEDFDIAIEGLPKSYSGIQRVTKGAAYAFKARTAIWMLDWATASAAAKGCMDLDVYSLHPDFGEMFLSKTRTSPEFIFVQPRSKALLDNAESTTMFLSRNPGGTANCQPSWELFCAFPCTDGKPIDESPLFSLKEPFKNRDPRCAATCVEFGTAHLGYIYDPSPAARTVLQISTNKQVTNHDSFYDNTNVANNGMCLKKGVDEEWLDDQATDKSVIWMRYADVLLMYAEAKMELNQIDASVLEALNLVRARAYKCKTTETTKYPAITETNQAKLRTVIRTERRCELAWENRRFYDLVRWRIAGVSMTRPKYGLLTKAGLTTNYNNGDYFFPKGVTIDIDENGCADFTAMYATGKIRLIVERNFLEREYLLPIPTKDVMINPNITQNPGY
ncbi:starch-binding protein [Bacteroidia bacterium]|nr:starch-binding protein [Bacteroidia bacterium]